MHCVLEIIYIFPSAGLDETVDGAALVSWADVDENTYILLPSIVVGNTEVTYVAGTGYEQRNFLHLKMEFIQ